jgi:hypothetical protein
LLENLEASVNTYNFRIETLEINDVTQKDQIDEIFDITGDLYASDQAIFAQLGEVQDKTMFQTRISTATIFSKQINIPNGNIGFHNSLLPNNFYIQSNLASGNNIILNSGLANIFLQSQNVYLGKPDATTGRKSNFFFYNDSGYEYEIQSSAFTEDLKGTLISNSYNVLQQYISITALENKTQYISVNTSAPLIIDRASRTILDFSVASPQTYSYNKNIQADEFGFFGRVKKANLKSIGVA